MVISLALFTLYAAVLILIVSTLKILRDYERRLSHLSPSIVVEVQTTSWSVKVVSLGIRDIALTENMFRLIAEQAEAERYRRARAMYAERPPLHLVDTVDQRRLG
jgi:hypothetical protein